MSSSDDATVAALPDAIGASRTIARLSRVIERCCTQAGLNLAQYRLLVFVNDAPQRAGALADRDAASGPSLTARVDALEAKGLVTRSRAADDRRGIELTLTEAGVVALGSIEACVQGHFDALFPATKGKQLLAGLARANAVLERAQRGSARPKK